MEKPQLPRRESLRTPLRQDQEPLVVGDQKGIVVVWPDGHSSRFSWSDLRQSCRCAECRRRREEETFFISLL
jgi:DUF971 family protein